MIWRNWYNLLQGAIVFRLALFYATTDAANGDNQWYQIASVTSATVLVLMNNYTGATVTGAGFTIGQCSILPEDYQNLPLFYMGMVYYSTRFPDQTRFNLYKDLYTSGIAQLDSEFGSKTTSVVLQDSPLQVINPNLFQSNISGH